MTRFSGLLAAAMVGAFVAQQAGAPAPARTPAPDQVPAALAAALAPPGSITPALPNVGPKTEPCAGIALDPGGRPEDWRKEVQRDDRVGKTFCLAAGTYQNFSVRPRSGQIFMGTPDTVLDGSVELPSAQFSEYPAPQGKVWRIRGVAKKSGFWTGGPCLKSRPDCHKPDDVFIGADALDRVGSLAEVKATTYWFPYENNADGWLYIGVDPQGKSVRKAENDFAFGEYTDPNWELPLSTDVVIADLVVQRYATSGHLATVGQTGASPAWTVRNVEARQNHGAGIVVNNGTARENSVHHNGHQGITGRNGKVQVLNNEIFANNTAGYDIGEGAAEGGAGKISQTDGAVYRGNYVHDNYGQGIWFDVYNVNATIEHNHVHRNEGVGIMYELSKSGVICGNQVHDNGAGSKLAGGKVYAYSAGILVSSSEGVRVSGNTVVVPKTFLYGRDDTLTADGKWKYPETAHGIIALQGTRTEDHAHCDAGDPLYWECDASNINVTDNVVLYRAELTYVSQGKGASGSGLLANSKTSAEKLKANVTFARNTYLMPNCASDRWYAINADASAVNTSLATLQTLDPPPNRARYEVGSTCLPIIRPQT